MPALAPYALMSDTVAEAVNLQHGKVDHEGHYKLYGRVHYNLQGTRDLPGRALNEIQYGRGSPKNLF